MLFPTKSEAGLDNPQSAIGCLVDTGPLSMMETTQELPHQICRENTTSKMLKQVQWTVIRPLHLTLNMQGIWREERVSISTKETIGQG